MEELNLNVDSQNLQQCLKGVSDFGSTTYMNICTGAENIVPWGAVDFFTFFLLSAVVIAFLLMFMSMVSIVVRS